MLGVLRMWHSLCFHLVTQFCVRGVCVVYFSRRCWYHKVVECVRRILLTGAIAWALPNTRTQIEVGFVVSALFLSICVLMKPFDKDDDGLLANTVQLVVTVIAFQALLQHGDEKPSALAGWLLVSLNASIGPVLVVQLRFVWRRALAEARAKQDNGGAAVATHARGRTRRYLAVMRDGVSVAIRFVKERAEAHRDRHDDTRPFGTDSARSTGPDTSRPRP